LAKIVKVVFRHAVPFYHYPRFKLPNCLKIRLSLLILVRYMLGEQYAELKGKITGQRVLDVEGPIIETSVSVGGSMRRIQVQEMITFIGTPTTEKGVIHGIGKGVIMVTAAGGSGGEPEMITYTGEGIGRLGSSGNVKWRGSLFFRTSSGSKLAFLNNMVGVFETEIDAEGNFSEKAWEWK
jgi:hypothetical protein